MRTREEILEKNLGPHFLASGTMESVFEAMDEYAKEMCIAFADYLDRNKYDFETKENEELFNQFLQSLNKEQ